MLDVYLVDESWIVRLRGREGGSECMGKMPDVEWSIGLFCPMSHKGTWSMAGQVQLYRSLDKCHREPLPWSTLEEKVTHLPGFLDVLTLIGECLLNPELLAGSQEDNIRPLYGFSVEWGNGRSTRQIREGCVPSLMGGPVWACPEEVYCGRDGGKMRI